MSGVWVVFKGAVRRAKLFIVLGAVAGLLLCVVFHYLASLVDTYYGPLTVGLADQDGTTASQDLERYLREDLAMAMEQGDMNHLEGLLVEKRISAIVIVPQGYEHALLTASGESPITVTVLDDYENAAFLRGYIESYAASAAMLAAGAGGDTALFARLAATAAENTVPVAVTETDEAFVQAAVEQEAFDNTIGFYLMLSFLLVLGLCNMLFDDRKEGMYRRVKASSIPTAAYVAGMCLVGMLASLAMAGVFLLYTAVSGFDIGMALWQATLPCLLYALVLVGFALVAGLYLPTRSSVMAVVVIGSTVTCLLGGAYFPIEMAPDYMQALGRATPQFWAMNALATARTGGSILPHLAILALLALLLFILAGVRFADTNAAETA